MSNRFSIEQATDHTLIYDDASGLYGVIDHKPVDGTYLWMLLSEDDSHVRAHDRYARRNDAIAQIIRQFPTRDTDPDRTEHAALLRHLTH